MLPSPPLSARKGLFGAKKPLRYYEDVYKTLNSEENYEGPAQKCETDSDSDDELSSPNDQAHASKKTAQASRKDTVLQPEESMGTSNEYKIAPKFKRSLPAGEIKKLKLDKRRFGMFASRRAQDLSEPSDVDEGSIADDEDSEMPPTKSERRSMKISAAVRRRPTSRRILKQQLAEKVLADKTARRAERLAAKTEKAAKRKVNEKAEASTKTSKKQHSLNGGIASASKSRTKPAKGKASVKGAIVVIDNRDIDFDEYARVP